MKKVHVRHGKRHFYMEETNPNRLFLTATGKPAYWSAYEMRPTVSRVCEAHARGALPKLLGHTATIEEAKALIEMEAAASGHGFLNDK